MSSGSYYKRLSDIVEHLRPDLPNRPAPIPPGMIKRIARSSILFLCLLGGATYAGDYALFRYRLARGKALASVDVEQVYAIPQKNGKTELDYVGTDMQTCVRSLFPHFGYTPCWYASRHRDQRTQF